jgi:hypothetical protein
MKRLIVPLLGIWLFAACDEHEKDPGLPVLTVEMERNAFPREEQKWIYISDADGKLLDSDMIHAGTFTLNHESVPDVVDVTIYTIHDFEQVRTHELITYLRVPTNKTFKIKKPLPVFFQQPIGAIKFEIANYAGDPSLSYFFISNGGIGINLFPFNTTFENTTVKGFYFMGTSEADLLFTNIRNGQRVYSWARGVHLNDVIQLDHQNFTPCEHTLQLPYSSFGNVMGMINGASYNLGSTYTPPYQSNSVLTYIDGFDYYLTEANSYAFQRLYHYTKSGDPPLSLTMPEYNGHVRNTSITDFDYYETADYSYRVARWFVQNHPLQWQVVGDEGPMQIKFFPRELKESFPDIDPPKFFYSGQTLYKRLDGRTYFDYLDETMGVVEPPKFYEYFSVDLYQ